MGVVRPRALATLTAALFLLAAPAVAHAATATSVAMYSDAGDYIGGGQQRLYTAASSTITLTGSTSDLSVNVSGGPSGDYFTFQFAAPPGQTLAPGFYTTAQRASFRTGGHAGIDVYGSGRGCNETAGNFEVRDIATDSSGGLQRLWIVYEQHCEGGPAALFGEVRVGEPVPDDPAAPATTTVRWPPADQGGAGTAVPVTLVAASSTKVTAVSVKGDNPGDFPVRLDDCSGKTLAAGAGCEVWTRFVPSTPGTRTARLDIADAGGHHYVTALEGFSYGGTTKAVMQSDSGDYIGAGQSYSYAPANATLVARGTRAGVSFGIRGANGDMWTAEFKPPSGDIIAPGSYDNAERAAFSGGAAGLDVYGNGRGCNTVKGKFTVTHATFDDGGDLRTFGATFEQHCEGAAPAFRGELDYRAGDDVPPPPWLGGSGSATGAPATPPGSGSPPTAASPAAAAVALRKPKHADIAYGSATLLRGTVKSAGKPVAGTAVTLQASPFPYAGYAQVAQAKTGPKGGYSFRVRPDRNTRYRVVAEAGTSGQRTVFVNLASKFGRKALGGGRFRDTLKVLGPPDVPYAGRQVFFYKLSHKGRVARRAARARLLGLGHGRLRASAVLRLRSRRAHTLVCMPEPTPDAWGRPVPMDRACGAPRLVSRAQPRGVIE